jgi:hypothetical protein
MKELIIVIFTFFTCTNLLSQELNEVISFQPSYDSSLIGESLCKTSQNMAKADIAQNRFMTYIPNNQFSIGLQNYILEKYEVYVFTNGTCLSNDFSNCYRKITMPLIEEKLGIDFIERSIQELNEISEMNKMK